MEAFIASIILFAGNFAPRGWAFCQGQLLGISQNSALFSLLGVVFGGNGQTTFGLPNLQGRTPIGAGNGKFLGAMGGEENHTLLSTEMPTHAHTFTIPALSSPGTVSVPNANSFPAEVFDDRGGIINAYGTGTPNVFSPGGTTSVVGGSQAHNNMQPFLVLNYIICMEGIYPSRN
jgi:microcystin-dependent protein